MNQKGIQRRETLLMQFVDPLNDLFVIRYSSSIICFSSISHPPSSHCLPLVFRHHLYDIIQSCYISIFQACYTRSLLYSVIQHPPYHPPSFVTPSSPSFLPPSAAPLIQVNTLPSPYIHLLLVLPWPFPGSRPWSCSPCCQNGITECQ